MKNIFITITGQNHYLGLKPFKVGRIVKIVKDVDNEYDEDAIRVELPFIDTIRLGRRTEKNITTATINDTEYLRIPYCTHRRIIRLKCIICWTVLFQSTDLFAFPL